MKKIIYYFSGTGNSLNAARIIAKELGDVQLIAMRKPFDFAEAGNADIVGFVFPVYEWDVPKTVKEFIELLDINQETYYFAIATYIAIHGRCFETIDGILTKKGARLNYGKAIRCVASQCTAYNPFPPEKLMVPISDKKTRKVAKKIASKTQNKYPRMSFVTRKLYPKMMTPFINVQCEYDKGFYADEKCVGCGVCQKVCPCNNLELKDAKPAWQHHCEGCNACVVYCPKKAIQFKIPTAYQELDNVITHKLGLPEKRKRYHNPHISAKDMMKVSEMIE